MHVVDLVSGAGLELHVEWGQQAVLDLLCAAALATDQVVVGMLGVLVDKLPVAYMCWEDQIMDGQEAQSAVDSGFGQARHSAPGSLTDLYRGQVPVSRLQDVQDSQSLRGHAVTQAAKLDCIGLVQENTPYCD